MKYLSCANYSGLVKASGSDREKLDDFSNLSSEIAKVTPSAIQMNDYNPTNTVASSCPTVGTAWAAASELPPTPDADFCECMAKAITCTVSDSVDDKDLDKLFGAVCGLPGDPCAGIAGSPSNGTYGAYSMCEARQKIAFALDTYDRAQKAANNQNGCDFSGSATRQNPVQPTGACSSKIQAAGDGTQPTGGSGGSGSGSGSGSSSSRGAAVYGATQASLNLGSLQVGFYAVVALVSGAGMILL